MTQPWSVQALAAHLHQLLDAKTIEDHCHNGIQVANEGPIIICATAEGATIETIKKAIELKVQALIVHHGIFWDGFPLKLDGSMYEKIKLLIHHNIALLGYHLPLDRHHTLGNNWKAARDLVWHDLEDFGEYNKTLIGVQGRFKPIPLLEFKQTLENYYGHPATIAPGKQMIQSAALVSGGAHDLLPQAVIAGVDCYITGNFDLSDWNIAHEEKIAFMALGHSATEKVGPKALAHHISTELDLPCTFIDSNNPF